MKDNFSIKNVSLHIEVDVFNDQIAVMADFPTDFFKFRGVLGVTWIKNINSMFHGPVGKRFLFVLAPEHVTYEEFEQELRTYLSVMR